MRRSRTFQSSRGKPNKQQLVKQRYVRNIETGKDLPDDHPRKVFMSRSVFNQHLAQASLKPVAAIADKIAKDHDLPPVNRQALLRYMENMKWDKAAFELQKNPPKTKQQKANWVSRYVLRPVVDYLNIKVPNRKLLAILGGTVGAVMVFTRLLSSIGSWENSAESVAKRVLFR